MKPEVQHRHRRPSPAGNNSHLKTGKLGQTGPMAQPWFDWAITSSSPPPPPTPIPAKASIFSRSPSTTANTPTPADAFPGGFIKREGRMSDRGSAHQPARSIAPLGGCLPRDSSARLRSSPSFSPPILITIPMFSESNAASAALTLSDIPFSRAARRSARGAGRWGFRH